LHRWSLNAAHASYGVLRMLVQLMLIGYLLAFIFESDSGWITAVVLLVMVIAASWIALGTMPAQRRKLSGSAIVSILFAGGLTLLLVTQVVLSL